jgi:hypothetical protein
MAGEAESAVQQKISGVESEQGPLKGVGSEPPADFGHGSASSDGTSGKIPAD